MSIEAAKPVRIDEPTFVSLEEEIALGTEQYLSSRPEEEEDEPQVSSPAAPASTPVRVAAGGVLGLIAGLVATALWARYDTHVHYSDEVETITGFPVLAEIPPLSKAQQKSHDILASDAPRSATTEAYRVVRTAILFADSARQLRASRLGNEDEQGMVVMVTSAGPGEGKTTTTANLATVFAEGGMSVAVIDCDFRRPTIHKYLLGEEDELIKERHGGDSLPEEALATLDNSWVDGVRLIHKVGTSQNSPIEIVHRQQQVIELARRHFDIVLLDTAPFMTTNDAADLMPLTDHIIFLVRSGLTRAQAIRRGADFLHRANAPVIGVVMTNSEEPEGYYYYYRRYYSNYYHDGKDASDAGSNGRLRSYTSRSRRSRLGQANQAEDLGGLQVDDPALS